MIEDPNKPAGKRTFEQFYTDMITFKEERSKRIEYYQRAKEEQERIEMSSQSVSAKRGATAAAHERLFKTQIGNTRLKSPDAQ